MSIKNLLNGSIVALLTIGTFMSMTAGAFESPLIVAHRGASGYRPEHTLASYELAIKMGADYIEPDLVMTKDGVLMARHENEISGTTDAAVKFPDRKTTKKVDGKEITGWFIEDFTLKEVKTLRAKERLEFRDHTYDGKFEVPTLKEILDLVSKQKRVVGVYIETKHPSYFQSIKLPLEEALLKELKAHGLDKVGSEVFIQSFELDNLKKIKAAAPVYRLIYLLDDPEIVPGDNMVSGDKRTYKDMLSAESLKEIAKTAYGIGPYKRYIVPADKDGKSLPATKLISEAHALGLKVHPYTFRSDGDYLLKEYKGNPESEYLQFFELGVDGLFSDFADHAVKAKKTYLKNIKAGAKK